VRTAVAFVLRGAKMETQPTQEQYDNWEIEQGIDEYVLDSDLGC